MDNIAFFLGIGIGVLLTIILGFLFFDIKPRENMTVTYGNLKYDMGSKDAIVGDAGSRPDTVSLSPI